MIDEKFTATFSGTNSSYDATYETEKDMQVDVQSDNKSFDTEFQEVVHSGDGEVSPEMIEQAVEDYFSKHPVQSTTEYPKLNKKPQINGVELNGNKTAADLGLQPKGNYLTEVPEGYVKEEDLDDFALKKDIPTDYVKPETLKEYAKKKDIPTVPTKVSAFQNDAGYLTEHQDLSGYAKKDEVPAVPDWAMAGTKPSYTAEEIGADAVGSAADALSVANKHTEEVVSQHNTDTDAHNDLRIFVAELTARVNALADSDDTTLDQMSEIVAYIKDNRELVEQVTTEKVSVTDIIDNLTTNLSNKVLSASMGVKLKLLIDSIVIPTKVSAFENDKGYLTEHQSLAGYATESWVEGKKYLTEHQDISGKLDTNKLSEAINTALAEAKSSGEFDGADGESGIYYGTEAPTSEIHPIWIDPAGDEATAVATMEDLNNLKAIIGKTYIGAWIASETNGTNTQVYTDEITVPAGTYVINVVTPYAGISDIAGVPDIMIRIGSGFLIGTGTTVLKSQYGSVTLLASFSVETKLSVKSGSTKNSATWSYLDRGGIAAVRIA